MLVLSPIIRIVIDPQAELLGLRHALDAQQTVNGGEGVVVEGEGPLELHRRPQVDGIAGEQEGSVREPNLETHLAGRVPGSRHDDQAAIAEQIEICLRRDFAPCPVLVLGHVLGDEAEVTQLRRVVSEREFPLPCVEGGVGEEEVTTGMIEVQVRGNDVGDVGRLVAQSLDLAIHALVNRARDAQTRSQFGSVDRHGVLDGIRMNSGIEEHEALGVLDEEGGHRNGHLAGEAVHQGDGIYGQRRAVKRPHLARESNRHAVDPSTRSGVESQHDHEQGEPAVPVWDTCNTDDSFNIVGMIRERLRRSEMDDALVSDLRARAHRLREAMLEMAAGKGEGYIAQGLGMADCLAVLYFHEMTHDPSTPDWADRDRFLLSTGHYSIAMYAVLAEAGYLKPEELPTYGLNGSRLPMSTFDDLPGVEIVGGSLGQGLGQAVGMALGLRLDARESRVFCEVSDGELQEGSTWEALMSATTFGCDNLVALFDCNGVQADGAVHVRLEPVSDKLRAFGWDTFEVNGNRVDELVEALGSCRDRDGRPKAIVMRTQPGSGVPTLERRERAHFVRITDEEWLLLRDELEAARPEVPRG